MNKKNVLVFPCGSEIGLDVYSSVKHSRFFHLIGGSSVDDHGRFVYQDYVGNIPFVSSTDFIPYLITLVHEKDIDAIYPTMDSVITVLKENECVLGCKIVCSSLEATKICLDKSLTYSFLSDYSFSPQVYMPGDHFEFPVFVKPRIGYGSRGAKVINNRAELDVAIAGKESDLMILEYLPGEEYTVDCFTDRNGRLLYQGARTRERIRNGISVNTSFVEDQEEFSIISQSINSVLSLRGAWFYQVKRDRKHKLKLLEVASRFGGSSLISRGRGVNLALLALFDLFNIDVSICQNEYNIELDRALDTKYIIDIQFDTVYVDYDDCLVLDNDTVNYELVSFIYKCRNQNKHVILLTKHEGDLISDLERLRLLQLFDEVIHISSEKEKRQYIHSGDSIFIDDSFSERMRVKKELGIPVFSPDMIDVLL